MTEAATAGQQPAEYIQLWAEQAAQVVGQITGAAAPCVAKPESPAEMAAAGEQDVWALVAASGGVRGEMYLRAAPATVLHLAQVFMSEPVNAEAELTGDHRDALIELLRQVAGLVSTAAKKRWGETQLHVEMAAATPSWPAAETFWLVLGPEGTGGMAIKAGLSAALVAELRAEKEKEKEKAEAPKAAAPPSSAASPPASAGDSAAPPGTLDLLLGVQLTVTMRFGARRLLLREVLELSPGAVVELDRRVAEPVELLLEGRLIARGEVVVIDGNYGLRVTDTSPMAIPVAGGSG
jgi:flagellar motor switch protein FliN